MHNGHAQERERGRKLVFPESSRYLGDKPFEPRAPQQRTVRRFLEEGSVFAAHETGVGKTATYQLSAVKSLQIGVHKRGALVSRNNKLDEDRLALASLYPGLRVLVVRPEDMRGDDRRAALVDKARSGDWDVIHMPQSVFERIPASNGIERRALQAEIARLQMALEANPETNGARRRTRGDLRRELTRLENRERDLANDEASSSAVLTLENLGVDCVFADEFHDYKNIAANTRMSHVSGITEHSSARAAHMLAVSQYLIEANNAERGLIGGTGSPAINSLAELHTWMRVFRPSELRELGLEQFDQFAALFTQPRLAIEPAPEGGYFVTRLRLDAMTNTPELLRAFRNISDVAREGVDVELDIPEVHTEVRSLEPTELQKAAFEWLAARAAALRRREPAIKNDNMLWVMHDAMLASLDVRLLDQDLPREAGSVAPSVVGAVVDRWERHCEDRGVQLLFLDLSVPGEEFSLYEDIRSQLIERGIPADQIAFAQDAKGPTETERLQEKMRRGDVAVVISTTDRLGIGANVQDRLVGVEHISLGFTAHQLAQRLARMARCGNQFKDVEQGFTVTQGGSELRLERIASKDRFTTAMDDPDEITARHQTQEMGDDIAELYSAASGSPLMKQRLELDRRIGELRRAETVHNNRGRMAAKRLDELKTRAAHLGQAIEETEADANTARGHQGELIALDTEVGPEESVGAALLRIAGAQRMGDGWRTIGMAAGLTLATRRNSDGGITARLTGSREWRCELGESSTGAVQRLRNLVGRIEKRIPELQNELSNVDNEISAYRSLVAEHGPFEHAEELALSIQAREALLEEMSELGVSNDADYDLDAFERAKAAYRGRHEAQSPG